MYPPYKSKCFLILVFDTINQKDKNFKLNVMRKITLLIGLWGGLLSIQAQELLLTFANAHNTVDEGKYYYETDVMIQSSESFKLGSGQIYLTYNTEAFGENIEKNNKIAYQHEDANYILGENYTIPAYRSFQKNDNTGARVSFAFQQGVSAESFTRDNVTTVPQKLFHIKLEYQDATQNPLIAFEQGAVYQDQFFTACGSMLKSGVKAGFPDCANIPGVQLVNDTYDSSGAALNVLNVEEQSLSGVSLYPNPSPNYFILKGLQAKSNLIQIFDMNGKLVKEVKDYTVAQQIQIESLQSGVYFVKLEEAGVKQTLELIKQ